MQIDYHDLNSGAALVEAHLATAHQYREARTRHATAVYELNILLASRMGDLRAKKSNLGHETALVMLLEKGDTYVQEMYKSMLIEEANYKGLEKILDAQNSQIILLQTFSKIRGAYGLGDGTWGTI